MELAESGMRYTQMPHVMEVGYIMNFLKNAYQPYFFFMLLWFLLKILL